MTDEAAEMTVRRTQSDAPNGSGRRIDILLPSPMHGSGGHRTAVQAGEALAADGFDVHVHFTAPTGEPVPDDEIDRHAREWHGAQASATHQGWPDELATDAVIATTWQSAVHAGNMRTDGVRMHFVQDYEAWFHTMGDEFLAALGVHDIGLRSVVIGDWLRHRLLHRHSLPSWTIPFTADLSLYRPAPAQSGGTTRRVVAMYQPDKPRRCGALMRDTLQQLLAADDSVEVLTVGSQHSPHLGTRHTHLGLLPRSTLAEVYASASVGFSLSSSNPSRVPFEMMAAGLPVVELGAENTVFDFPGAGMLLAHPDPWSLTQALLQVLRDDDLRAGLSRGGREYMLSRDAPDEGRAFVRAVTAALAGETASEESPTPRYGQPAVAALGRPLWQGTDPSDISAGLFVDAATEQLRINEELNRANHALAADNQRLGAEVQQLLSRTLKGRLKSALGRAGSRRA